MTKEIMSELKYFEPVEVPAYTFYTLKTKLYREIIQRFLDSNYKCVRLNLEILDKTPRHAYESFNSCIRTHKYPIKVFRRNNELYLIKIPPEET